VRVSALSLRPIARERSRTAVRFSFTFTASFRPSRASALTPSAARPASVGQRTSASTTVESILAARGRNRFSRLAFWISSRVSSCTTSAPNRRVSLRTVDSSGTRSLSPSRQNLRRCSESDTFPTNVSYP